MRYGLFGKLPARRDFITHAVPRPFLHMWEAWLEKSLSESRTTLGVRKWEETFRSAPIWRFWLGSGLCGENVIGAFMPSMDAVGRYFPLTLAGIAEGEALAPPDIDPRHAWFAKAEDVLLSALEPEASLEMVLDETANLDQAIAAGTPLAGVPKFGLIYDGAAAMPLGELFAVCRKALQDCSLAEMSFWWTTGGEGFKPAGLVSSHLPQADVFTSMLTGHFDRHGEEKIAIGVKPL